MSNYEKKNKHLTFYDRLSIQGGLSKGMPVKSIAQNICKCPTTISREVKIHLISHTNNFVKRDILVLVFLNILLFATVAKRKVVIFALTNGISTLLKNFRLTMRKCYRRFDQKSH